MPKRLTLTEAQQQMLNLPDELTDEPILITKDGEPVMAAMSYEHLTSLLETLEILSDAEFAEKLRESIAQADRGETISWEDAQKKLER
jgi:antitoxin YefM